MANLIDLLQAYDGKNAGVPAEHRTTGLLHRKFLVALSKATKSFLKECEFRPVASAVEFQSVAKIVNTEIRRSRVEERELKARWFSLSQATDRSVTFVCLYKKKHILGTVTMVLDSPMGMPSDQLYKTHMSSFRSMGREMAEITSLVLNSDALASADIRFSRADRLILALQLMKAAVEYSMHANSVDTVVIRCNRRHEIIHKALFYRPLTGLEYYTGKDKQEFPAFFLDLDILKQHADQSGSRLWGINFDKVRTTVQKPFRLSLSQLMQAFSLTRTAA
jgi:hypothetical protein